MFVAAPVWIVASLVLAMAIRFRYLGCAADKEQVSSEAGHSVRSDRWFGVGESAAADSRTAGADAAVAALAGREARLLIVFASDSYDHAELLRGVAEQAPEVPLVGCSTAGEIAASGPGDAGVVVSAIGGEGFSVATAAAEGASGHLREVGAKAASCLGAVTERSNTVLLLLTDGLAGDQAEIVRGAYSVAGARVPLVGGCAGDDLKMQATFQFHGGRVLTDAVVAAAVTSDGPLGIGVRHGWRTVGEPIPVTRAQGNVVAELDGQPALDAYLGRLDAPEEAHTDAGAFTRFAQTHPLGLASRSGEPHVRFVGGADFERRSLACIAEVPQGGLAWLMEGDAGSVLEATDGACGDALAALNGHAPLGVVAFDCIARRGVLGESGITAEVERVAQHADGAPVAGFYTYGEIARTRGVSGFHNQTLVLLALG